MCFRELSIRRFDFAAYTFQQHDHRAKAKNNLQNQIEDGSVLQISGRNGYSPQAVARTKDRHIVEKIKRQQNECGPHHTQPGTGVYPLDCRKQHHE